MDVEVRLLRSTEWLIQNRIEVWGIYPLSLPELNLAGDAFVVGVSAAPVMTPGPQCPVTGVVSRLTNVVWTVSLAGMPSLGVTPQHPLWSLDRGGWIPAEELRNGERLAARDGEVLVQRVSEGSGRMQEVLTLEVAMEHRYFVGAGGVWAHNASTMPKLPPATIAKDRGITIKHNYGGEEAGPGAPVEHGPAHAHVKGPGGENPTRIGPLGHPLDPAVDPPMTPAQQGVYDANRSLVRNALNRAGRWLRAQEEAAPKAEQEAAKAEKKE
jgi:hypothetical protein